MNGLLRIAVRQPGALAGATLWGLVELLALWRSRRARRWRRGR
jgi:hypothetical protein